MPLPSSQHDDFQKLRRILKRRFGWLVLPFLLTVLASVALALALPNIYQSTATILVRDQRIPDNLVPSTVPTYADERVQAITQEVVSRTRIVNLAEKYNLLGEKRRKMPIEDMMEKIKSRLTIEPVNAEVNTGRSDRPVTLMIAFRLSYEDESPKIAQAVTNEIASYYLEKNLESRERIARGTTQFLQEQMEQVKARIGELENTVAEFRKAHMEELPEFTQLNMQRLEKLNADIGNINMQLRHLEEQKAAIRSQLAALGPYAGSSASGPVLSPALRLQQARMERAQMAARYSEDHPLVQAKNREIALLEKSVSGTAGFQDTRDRVQQLENQLASLTARYSSDHPEVQKVRKELEKVRAELAYLEKSSRRSGEAPSSDAPANPAFVSLKADLAKIEVSINSLKEEKEHLEEQSRQLYEKLQAMPEVAKQYSSLVTELDMAKAHYQELQQKFLAAKVSQSMEEDRLGETFEVIEPALLPEKPAKPNRIAIGLIGAVLGLGLSVGLAALREFTDVRLHDREDLERIADMPVLSLIPALVTEEDRRRKRRRRLVLAAAGLGSTAGLVILFHLLVMDLHIFYAKVVRFLESRWIL
ncbi:MAG: Wzz/FepE/Etk N-terminal domain-containing protein [Desulfosoma sp.]